MNSVSPAGELTDLWVAVGNPWIGQWCQEDFYGLCHKPQSGQLQVHSNFLTLIQLYQPLLCEDSTNTQTLGRLRNHSNMASNTLDFSRGCLGKRGKCQSKQRTPALWSDAPLLSDQSFPRVSPLGETTQKTSETTVKGKVGRARVPATATLQRMIAFPKPLIITLTLCIPHSHLESIPSPSAD